VPTSDSNQTTGYTYDGIDDVLCQTAVMPTGTDNQVTQYVYGISGTAGTDLFDNDMLLTTEYPDASTGAASATASDDQSYTYDLQGELETFTDQNATVHTYSYDPMGRETLDSIAVPEGNPAGIDLSIQSLGYSYDTGGRLLQATSYSNSNGTGSVNYVHYSYNGLGQETSEKQFHGGDGYEDANNIVEYNYASIDDGSRLTSMTYPNGRVEDYLYTDSLDSAITRLTEIADGYDYSTGLDNPQSVQRYSYLGLDTIVNKVDGNGVELTYATPSGETGSTDGGDQYKGLDRFGRVIGTIPGPPAATNVFSTVMTRTTTYCTKVILSVPLSRNCIMPTVPPPGMIHPHMTCWAG
jgi:YD repeat-containing protein